MAKIRQDNLLNASRELRQAWLQCLYSYALKTCEVFGTECILQTVILLNSSEHDHRVIAAGPGSPGFGGAGLNFFELTGSGFYVVGLQDSIAIGTKLLSERQPRDARAILQRHPFQPDFATA